MRDLKLDKDFERSISKSSLVPAAAVDEPQDPNDIVPEKECMPIETFWLLLRDNAAMKTSIARKDMMVLEKDAVIKSMEAKLATFTQSLNLSTEQHDMLKQNKAVEMDELQYALQEKHEEYRREIQKLLYRNMELKNRLLRQPPPQTVEKLPNRGRMVF
jgi:ribosomal protein L16 Arg81 hydroxylase